MHTLTSDLCDKFVYAEIFNADALQLRIVEPNAFQGCRKVERLYLRRNFLTHLDPHVFKMNTRLRYVGLALNNFTKIDTQWFENAPLTEEILLSNNLLTEFPIQGIRPMKYLDSLYLQGNKLSDVDEHEIVRKFPKLREISLCHNEGMNPVREKALMEFFKARNVTTICETFEPIER